MNKTKLLEGTSIALLITAAKDYFDSSLQSNLRLQGTRQTCPPQIKVKRRADLHPY